MHADAGDASTLGGRRWRRLIFDLEVNVNNRKIIIFTCYPLLHFFSRVHVWLFLSSPPSMISRPADREASTAFIPSSSNPFSPPISN